MTKRLFLTSSVGTPGVARSIRQKLGGTKPLKTVFITTPVEVEDLTDDKWYQQDRSALSNAGFDFFDYTITGKLTSSFHQDLKDIDVLYISGGNTAHLLHQSHRSGFIEFVRDFVNSGKPYIGTSAGSIIAGPTLPRYLRETYSKDSPSQVETAYGLVDFTVIPHWGSPMFKDLYLGGRIKQIYLPEQPYILLNDNQYVEVKDNWYRLVDVTST